MTDLRPIQKAPVMVGVFDMEARIRTLEREIVELRELMDELIEGLR
jgi:uncharacterized protein YceH (UPF0502 family)